MTLCQLGQGLILRVAISECFSCYFGVGNKREILPGLALLLFWVLKMYYFDMNVSIMTGNVTLVIENIDSRQHEK